MSGQRVAAITRRLLQQFRRDHRTLALLFVAPIVILGLLGYLIRGSASAPEVGVANEDQGPLGGTVAAALDRSSLIKTTSIAAADGDSRLKDGSLVAYIVFPADFSRQAQAGSIAPEVHLEGSLARPWVQAKDVILELLRRLSTSGGKNKVFEFTGPGTADLAIPERGTIANMIAELGATGAIFPADEETKAWLEEQERGEN